MFWGLRSKAAALRFGARYSLGPASPSAPWSGAARHPAASLGLRAFGPVPSKNSLVQGEARAQKVRKKTKKLLLPKYKFNLALCEQAFVAKQLIAKPSTKQHHQYPILGQ